MIIIFDTMIIINIFFFCFLNQIKTYHFVKFLDYQKFVSKVSCFLSPNNNNQVLMFVDFCIKETNKKLLIDEFKLITHTSYYPMI